MCVSKMSVFTLHVDTGSPLARLAARRAAVLFIVLFMLLLGPPPSFLDGDAASRGTVCRQRVWCG